MNALTADVASLSVTVTGVITLGSYEDVVRIDARSNVASMQGEEFRVV